MTDDWFDSDHGQLRTAAQPRRVFSAVSAAPLSPAPRAWNHPLAAMGLGLLGSILLNTTPGVPPTAGIWLFVLMLATAAACAVNRYCWSVSRVRAAEESVWVARQSGYRFDGDAQVLRWLDTDGLVKVARLVPGRGVWSLQLQDAVYAQAKVSGQPDAAG